MAHVDAAVVRDVLLAAQAATGDGLSSGGIIRAVVSSLIFVGIGLAVFLLAFLLITKITPFSIRKEIEDDQNTALAVVIGSVIIGLAIIIAAAIAG
ncbi:MAG: DUF350 domain-containing protein [Deltaproteobacteria bacterium]|nr:DUF350 domain-containing protein [Deltaproteobacteria bacterium]